MTFEDYLSLRPGWVLRATRTLNGVFNEGDLKIVIDRNRVFNPTEFFPVIVYIDPYGRNVELPVATVVHRLDIAFVVSRA